MKTMLTRMALVLSLAFAVAHADYQTLAASPSQVAGSAMTLVKPDTVYAVFGGDQQLRRYIISADQWQTLVAPMPFTPAAGTALTSDRQGNMYILVGGGTSQCWRFTMPNTFTQMTSLPLGVSAGGSIAWVSYNGSYRLYASVGGGSTGFYRYENLAWTQINSPRTFGDGATMTWVPFNGHDSLFVVHCDGSRSVMSYCVQSNTWQSSKLLPTVPGSGCGIAYQTVSAGERWLYCARGANTAKNYYRRADLVSDNWSSCGDLPYLRGTGGAVASGHDNWYYVLFGTNQTHFVRVLYYRPGGSDTSVLGARKSSRRAQEAGSKK